jgi:hypothetical protein
MSKRMVRIISREITRLKAREKPAIRASLPKPENDERQIHQDQNKGEKKIDPVQANQDPDGKEPGVVTEEIPAANVRIKDFAITSAIFFANPTSHGPRRQGRLNLAMQPDEAALHSKIGAEHPADQGREICGKGAWRRSFRHDSDVGVAMIHVHLGVNGGRDPGEHHPDENCRAPSAVKETRADREKNGDMSNVSTGGIEDTTKVRHPARHSRELSVRRVDDPVKNENGEGEQAEPFVIEERAPGDPDERTHDRHSRWTHAYGAGAPRDQRPGWTEKINVRQLLDLDSLEGESLSGNRLVVTGRHKAVRCTPFPGRCKSRSGGLQTAAP